MSLVERILEGVEKIKAASMLCKPARAEQVLELVVELVVETENRIQALEANLEELVEICACQGSEDIRKYTCTLLEQIQGQGNSQKSKNGVPDNGERETTS